MGITHYWTWRHPPENDRLGQCLADMEKVLLRGRGVVAGPDGEGTPQFQPTRISFNGTGEECCCEPFEFPGKVGFNFCKTQLHPYDRFVTACLLVAKKHFHDLEIESDMERDSESWLEGTALFREVFGHAAPAR